MESARLAECEDRDWPMLLTASRPPTRNIRAMIRKKKIVMQKRIPAAI